MAYNDLREFITRLEREKELKRIGVEVDVDLEITEITDRVSKAAGPALLFEKPRSAKDGKVLFRSAADQYAGNKAADGTGAGSLLAR